MCLNNMRSASVTTLSGPCPILQVYMLKGMSCGLESGLVKVEEVEHNGISLDIDSNANML